jgi:Galactose oxidase, central domain
MTRRSAALPLVLVLSFCNVALAQPTGTFTPTGNMLWSRVGHTATLLPDGKVLIAGGQPPICHCQIFSSAELYDPSTGSFTWTGDMTTARTGHTATLLPDGKVLIAGGRSMVNTPQGLRQISLASAELYDPTTGTFATTGNMAWGADSAPSAILLNDGKVLIAHAGLQPATAELYDPVTGTFSSTGNQVSKLSGIQTVNLLPDGRVLLVICCMADQLYDPASGTFSLTDRTKRINYDGFGAAALTDGTVLFTGGYSDTGPRDMSGAELYDPSSGSFRPTGNMTSRRYYHTATPLPDGTVLIAGGDGIDFSTTSYTSAEIYDPATGAFSRTGDMNYAHTGHTATLLLDGSVLVTGGSTGYPLYMNTTSAEVYIPSILVPIPVVRAVRFDRMVVPAGSSFSVDLSGSNLTPEMFFDVRLTSPESNESVVALNWQNGLAENHKVPAGLAPGSWTITGVRAHRIETDHTGIFFPISATLTVSP